MKDLVYCAGVALVVLAGFDLCAQTAPGLIQEGRGFLAQRDMTNANARFQAAVAAAPDYSVQFSRHFDGRMPWRSWLPEFSGNGIIANSWPDLTFNQLIFGLAPSFVDNKMSEFLTVLPVFYAPSGNKNNALRLQLHTLDLLCYGIETSADLVHWWPLGNFVASNGIITLPATTTQARHLFYRAHQAYTRHAYERAFVAG